MIKSIQKLYLTLLITFIFSFLLNAQNPIPNPGFENWTSNTPDGWLPNNQMGQQPAVTPSSDAHSGGFSAKLEVVDVIGFPFPPNILSGTDGLGFPVSQRYEALNGYFKFAPQSGNASGDAFKI
ncbi:MAG: hypothetical protein JSW63_11690 [Ignavibacterium sp.]|nr:MAG: hypothetical protein JSW63_11690 [Ignavibacterium sp.]